jgi:hypothetical protein
MTRRSGFESRKGVRYFSGKLSNAVVYDDFDSVLKRETTAKNEILVKALPLIFIQVISKS